MSNSPTVAGSSNAAPLFRPWGRRVAAGALWLAVVTSMAGCAYRPRPVVLEAGPREWRAMVGTWRGSYSTADPGRHGLIDFTLAAGADQAFGDVLMTIAGRRDRYTAVHDETRWNGTPGAVYSDVLTIQFIRASDGGLRGVMTPYWDPERACEATATFYGAIGDGRMDGTFTSLCADGVHAVRGTWSVTLRSQTGG